MDVQAMLNNRPTVEVIERRKLSQLFDAQAQLDEAIYEKHAIENKEQNLRFIFTALFTEVGEMANEWRGFKTWSTDREPRYEKLLVETVDVLHFLLSIGLLCHKREVLSEIVLPPYSAPNRSLEQVNERFLRLHQEIGFFVKMNKVYADAHREDSFSIKRYANLMQEYFRLVYEIGFSFEEIIKAYYKKNAVNLQRQEEGY